MYGESDPLNQNCDSEIKIIIGKLLKKSKGDNVAISILSSFNHAFNQCIEQCSSFKLVKIPNYKLGTVCWVSKYPTGGW